MLPLDDPRWKSLKGGYRIRYDPTPVLRRLSAHGASDEIWDELWQELHHQGDVDQASYACVPYLAGYIRNCPILDWNPLALIAQIELCRPRNPEIDPELSDPYFSSIRDLPAILGSHPDQSWSEETLRSATACIALAHGNRWFAKAYLELDRDTACRWFSEEFGWTFGEK